MSTSSAARRLWSGPRSAWPRPWRVADVGEDRVLVPVAVGDVVESLGDHVGHGVQPVDGADVAPGGLQGAAQRLGVLDGAVAGLFGGELGVGEPAAADEHLEFHLGGDLRAGDVGVEGADQDVDCLVGGAQVDPAAGSRHLLDELEVVVAAHIAAVGAEHAVDGAEAAVDAADVDQVLQDPAGDPFVLLGGAPGRLGGDTGQQPADDLVVVGTGVEVHRQGDQVDRGECHFGHGVRADTHPRGWPCGRRGRAAGRCRPVRAAGGPAPRRPRARGQAR